MDPARGLSSVGMGNSAGASPPTRSMSDRLSTAINGIGHAAARIDRMLGRARGEPMAKGQGKVAQADPVMSLCGSAEQAEHLADRMSKLADQLEDIA
jgi:hypothetical protein